MEKQKENLFSDKFRLLNSQENSEEIHWSSSCSSGYEDTSLNDRIRNHVSKARVLKRKRKKKDPKNVCNLSITILDTSREKQIVNHEEKSPILGTTARRRSTSTSPILKPSQAFLRANNTPSSPILTSKRLKLKSPILVSKTASPKSSFKVRKKLFNAEKFCDRKIESDRQKIIIKQEVLSDLLIEKEPEDVESEVIIAQSIEFEDVDENVTLDSNISKAKVDLIKRVKSFFDSHFSSQHTSISSQNSISDTSSTKNSTKTSDEIELFTCKTQVLSNDSNISIESRKEQSSNSSENSVYDFSKNAKKIRYKKYGHANRLNKLLKKQKASLSLWQHERFLAANSNFVIPKGECTVFRIQKVGFQYGCHLLECVDFEDEKFLILINNCYVLENIVSGLVLKLYMPYIVEEYCCDCKLIINVTKFECSSLSGI